MNLSKKNTENQLQTNKQTNKQTTDKKIHVAVVFGGRSGEHEVSITSAMSVYKALDKNKYDVTMIGIDKSGRWLLPSDESVQQYLNQPRKFHLGQIQKWITCIPYESQVQMISMTDKPLSEKKQRFDVIVPILHGTYGEDGTIQGLLEMANIPYVGSGVLGSALGMDKELSRKLFSAEGIPVVPTLSVKKTEYQKKPEKIFEKIQSQFEFPFFVKPANMGSSVGVHKVKNIDEMKAKIEDSFLYDTKILIEKAVAARELECSVLGNDEPKASIVGEIIPQHEFYSYEAKYLDENGALLKIPAEDLSPELIKKIQDYSLRAFRAIECKGLARVDFFLDKNTNELFLNEINTIPGFTSISMYPKLWEATGVSYKELLDELITLALETHKYKNELKTSFSD